jgi:hypothetical protein
MPIIKHGPHRIFMPVPAAAASATVQTELPYEFTYGTYSVYDSTSEVISRATLVTLAALQTGDTLTLNHYNSAGTLVDAVPITAAQVTASGAHLPLDLTGNSASTGNSFLKGWTMNQGDSLEAVFVASTQVATRVMGLMLLVTARGA